MRFASGRRRMASRSNRPAPDVTFLIDECLNRALAKIARDQGFDGYHTRAIGLGGGPDKLVAEYAVANGMVVVTNDARDYRAIYRRFVSHPSCCPRSTPSSRYGSFKQCSISSKPP